MTKEEFIQTFERNKDFIFYFHNEYKNYLDKKTNHWKKAAFIDGKITHNLYYDALVRI